MSSPVSVWIDSDAQVSGAQILDLLKVKTLAGALAYKVRALILFSYPFLSLSCISPSRIPFSLHVSLVCHSTSTLAGFCIWRVVTPFFSFLPPSLPPIVPFLSLTVCLVLVSLPLPIV